MRFADKVVMVTGGSSGLGRAISIGFAKEGARVILADVLDADGSDAVAEIASGGGTAQYAHLDVSSPAEWECTIDRVLAEHAKIDVLVNNAGISGTSFPDVLDIDAWNHLMSVNATGAFLGIHFVVPVMQRAKHGVIVNMSSISAIIGQSNVHVAYNASKASIAILTKSTAVQFGRDGIRCNSVHPGLMLPMRTSGNVKDPSVRAKFVERVPLGRTGETDEVVGPVMFLASHEASYVTGVELYVDGGYLAG